jgi:hypothetical protein
MRRIVAALTGLMVFMTVQGGQGQEAPLGSLPAEKARSGALPMFAPETVTAALLEGLITRASDPRWVCDGEEPRQCQCVVVNGQGYRLVIDHWSEARDRTSLTGVYLVDRATGAHFHFGRVQFEVLATVVEVEDVTYVPHRANQDGTPVLRIDWMRVDDTGLLLEDLRWRYATVEGVESEGQNSPCAPGAPLTQGHIANAASASHDGHRWRIEGLKLAPGGIPVAAVESQVAPGTSGWLPPGVTLSGSGGEVEGSYYFARPAMSVGALAGWPASVGLTAAHYSRSARSGEGAFQRLRLDGRYVASTGGVEVAAVGSSRVGTGRRHGSAELEMVSPSGPWDLYRLERGAAFRPWKQSRAGLSLSSAGHALELQGQSWTLSGDEATEFQASHSESRLMFGGRYAAGPGSELHASAVAEVIRDEAGRDGAALVSRLIWQSEIGSARRLYLRPWVAGILHYGLTNPGSTTVVHSGARIAVGAETGLSLEGRFSRGIHRLRPRLVGFFDAIEVGGGQGELDESASSWAGLGAHGVVAGVIADQSAHSRRWELAFPTGLFVVADEHGSLVPFLGTVVRLSTPAPVQGEVAMSCRGACREPVTHLGFDVIVTRWLTLTYQMARSADAQAWLPLSLVRGASPALLSTTAGATHLGDDPRWFYRPAVRLAAAHWRLDLSAPGVVEQGSLPGLAMSLRTMSALPGWQLGIDVAHDPAAGRWMAMLGLNL